MKYLFGFCILLIVLIGMFLIISSLANEDSDQVEIILSKCVDGDTAWFLRNGEEIKVRFLGIDTPESTGGVVEEYGKEASQYTCRLLEDASLISLRYDEESDQKDKYGRILGWIFVDNQNISELLLKKGYAVVKYIYGDYLYLNDLCKAQESAYLHQYGIWSITDDFEYQNNYCFER